MLEAQLKNLTNYQVDENDVNNTSTLVTAALQNSAIQPKKRKSKPWFNSVLYHKLRLFMIMRQRNDPMVASAKLDYKRACRRRIFEYNAEKEQLAIRQAESDPRNFWKIMKSKPCTPRVNSIPISDWENHFRSILQKSNTELQRFEPEPFDDYDDLFT